MIDIANKNQANIDEFESHWTKWNVKDSVKWFKYIINRFDNNIDDDDDYDSDYDIIDDTGTDTETSSSNDDSDSNINESDETKMETIDNYSNSNDVKTIGLKNIDLDYNEIETKMTIKRFKAKHYLPTMEKSTFKKFGFYNPSHYRILFKKTKQLIDKYPKKKRNNKGNQHHNVNIKNNNNNNNHNRKLKHSSQIEGFIQVT